jgi:Holliday junction resolvasome RuvABC DNA-binding subunit
MVSAGKEEWLSIPGIGVKTAEAIHRALRTKEKE